MADTIQTTEGTLLRKTGILLLLFSLLIAVIAVSITVDPVKAVGTIYIRADGSIDPPTAPIQKNGDSYTFTDDIYDMIVVQRTYAQVNGMDHVLQGPGTGFGWGFDLSNVGHIVITSVIIRGWGVGVGIYRQTAACAVWYCNITDNGIGINIIENNGLRNHIRCCMIADNTLIGVSIQDSSGNNFEWNQFINNAQHAFVNPINQNLWSYNCWSNYTGEDMNRDGIGDSPHVICASNTDYHPWTPYDAAVIEIISQAIGVLGARVFMCLSVQNQGSVNASFAVTVYANTTAIELMEIIIAKGDTVTVFFDWETSGFSCGIYNISVCATPGGDPYYPYGELDTADNTLVGDLIELFTMPNGGGLSAREWWHIAT